MARQIKGNIKYSTTLDEEQKLAKESIFNNQIVVITGRAGSGKSHVSASSALDLYFKKEVNKILVTRANVETGRSMGYLPGAQPYSSKILTPNGWTTMGEIKKGDKVFASDGSVVDVTGVFEHGVRPVYEITTLQGKTTRACDKHIWQIQENNYRGKRNMPKLVNTTYIKDNLLNKYNGYKIILPEHSVVNFEERNINIHPYLLGVLLGDGYISSKSPISFSSTDSDVIERVRDIVSTYDMEVSNNKKDISYFIKSNSENNKPARKLLVKEKNGRVVKYDRIGDFLKNNPDFNPGHINYSDKNKTWYNNKKFKFLKSIDFSTNYVKNELNKLGLLDKNHLTKFIPDDYKYNTYNNRLEMLKGLLDTDGGIKKNGNVYFTTTSTRLRDDIIEIVRSLGGRAGFFERDRIGNTSTYGGRDIVTRNVSYEVSISFREYPDIFHLRRKKDRLLKGSNIHYDRVKDVSLIGEEPVKCIKIDHPSELYITDNYIVTHNTINEKFNPYLEAFKENLMQCYSDTKDKKEKLEKMLSDGTVDALPIAFIRGKTVNDVLVVEESQNLSVPEISSILSRLGKNGRIIFNGDFDQIDTRDSYTGLHYLLDMANSIPEIKVHKLKNNHRSDLVGKILDWESARRRNMRGDQ